MCPCQGSRRAAQAYQSCFPIDLSSWSRLARSSVFSSLTEQPAIFQKLTYMENAQQGMNYDNVWALLLSAGFLLLYCDN